MRTDPDPDKVRAILHCEGAVIDPDPHGPQLSNFLEMQGGVRWAPLQELEILSGYFLDSFRQARQGGPETRGCAMHSEVLESPLGLLLASLTH